MNSYRILWIGRLRRARSSEQFLWFSKNYMSWSNRIFSFFEARISCVFLIFLLRSIKAYLCPTMINFDAVDFSERHPEEVISFFWRSVYIKMLAILSIGKCHRKQCRKKILCYIGTCVMYIYNVWRAQIHIEHTKWIEFCRKKDNLWWNILFLA